jgi:sporulation protein YlmC with PRC-barrel domain
MSEDNNLREKKLRGSGGYVLARLTEEEQRRGNLGGPELFLAGVGRLDEGRLSKYYCNKCEKEYEGSPSIKFENPNEEIGEGVTLIEKGAYKCETCDNTIAQYRKFNAPASASPSDARSSSTSSTETNSSIPSVTLQQSAKDNKIEQKSLHTIIDQATDKKELTPVSDEEHKEERFIPIQTLVGMPAYDSDALLVGNVQEIGLHKAERGTARISLRITKSHEGANDNNNGEISSNYDDASFRGSTEVSWDSISKIGDIILLASETKELEKMSDTSNFSLPNSSGRCPSCNYQNEDDAVFCESCGTKLV